MPKEPCKLQNLPGGRPLCPASPVCGLNVPSKVDALARSLDPESALTSTKKLALNEDTLQRSAKGITHPAVPHV